MSAGKAARVGAHLPGCAQCTQVSSDLAGVSSLLSSIPAPPMPDRVTERLQAALTAEASHRGTEPVTSSPGLSTASSAAGPAVPGWPDLPERERHGRRSRRLRLPSWSSPLMLRGLAAIGVLVLVVGGVVLATSRSGKSGHVVAGSAGQRSGPSSGYGPKSAGINVGTRHSTKLSYRSGGRNAHADAVVSGANYTTADLVAGIRREVASATGSKFSMSPGYTAPLPRPGGPSGQVSHAIGPFKLTQLERCLATVAGRRPVLLAEVARYLGKPAVIVVLKPVNKVLNVVVAGLACGAGGGDVLKKLSMPQG